MIDHRIDPAPKILTLRWTPRQKYNFMIQENERLEKGLHLLLQNDDFLDAYLSDDATLAEMLNAKNIPYISSVSQWCCSMFVCKRNTMV